MKLVTIDFESYYGTRCDIKSLGMSQYVAHPDWEAMLLGVKIQNQQHVFVKDEIDDFFAWLKRRKSPVALCSHNMHFDGYAAMYHYDYVADFMLCTVSMAQPIHGSYRSVSLASLAKFYELGEGKLEGILSQVRNKHWENLTREQQNSLIEYCEVDTELCEQLFFKLKPAYPVQELKLIDLTLQLFIKPMMQVDVVQAQQVLQEERLKKLEACKLAGAMPSDLKSNPKFAALLRERGYTVPEKWSEKQQKMIPAIAQGDLPFKQMQDTEDPKLKALIEARIACKSSLNETRAQALLNRAGRPIPIGLRYCAAHTMRWGGTDKFNPQNLPRDGRLRKALVAPSGYKLVVVDAAQIEARFNAWFCDERELLRAFAQGRDVYAEFASELYGFKVSKGENPTERFVGKTSILGLGYNMGALKFQNTLKLGQMGPPLDLEFVECERAVRLYRRMYRKISTEWRILNQKIAHMLPNATSETEYKGLVFRNNGTILMPNGLSLHYPGLALKINPYDGRGEYQYFPYDAKYKKPIKKKLYGGLMLENIIQCLARICTGEHMLQLSEKYRVVHMAHDEIIFCVPKAQAERCMQEAIATMSQPAEWAGGCPLAAEGEISQFYTKP